MSKPLDPPPLGKYQQLVSYCWFQLIYFSLYFVTAHLFYSIVTFDLHVLAFYLTVSLAQSKIKRNQRYIDWITHTVQFRKGVKSTQLLFEEEITAEERCLFGFHPHGVLAVSFLIFLNYPNTPLSNFRGLASRFMMSVPFTGIMLRLMGFEAVDGHHMKHLLHNGKNVGLLPGGYQEATITASDELRLFINNRKGFIKYALEYNYTIHPVLCLNQHRLFWTLKSFEKARLWLNKFKLPEVFYWNKKSGVFPPGNIDYVAVVGKGIQGRHYEEGEIPTQEQIDDVHARYIEEIKRMYEKHKDHCQAPLKIY